MNLHDVIQINPEHTSAAIVLEQGVSDNALVAQYTPTQASIQVFEHFCQAVLPSATSEQRAINLYGSYGSGKSHLAVVLAQLLRDGAKTPGFTQLMTRLEQAGNKQLAEKLKNTFLPQNDAEARPYLLVSLYASGTTSLGAKLMEGLYDALQRERKLDIKEILPSTEYEVCVKRFEEMITENSAFENADLSQWNLEQSDFLATEDLLESLKNHQPSALDVFLQWHKAVCFGQPFDISQSGGKNYIEAYFEAGKNLAEKYHYGGIVVLWDEFGNALEDLIGNPARNAGQEIISLQKFVETVCEPDSGHTFFVGVTHVSFQEYGDRTHASEVVKEGLEKISGRLNKPFRIELNASEKDGYHLLGMQKTWSAQGRQLLSEEQSSKTQLLQVCQRLPLFQPLSEHLEQVFEDVYPMHPVMAVGLFNLSKLAQANRTALTFFRDNAGEILNAELEDSKLWQKELVRLPKLLNYYAENLKKVAGSDWRRYEQAINQVNGETPAENQARKDILNVLLLAQLLGENFKASDELLACALYDAFPNTPTSEPLNQNLAWLKGAGLIWKNNVTHFWTLAGEGGVDIDKLIEKNTSQFSGRSYQYLLENYPVLQEDILPVLGVHDLDPSSCGIIRSYSVSLLTPPFSHEQLKFKTDLLSARVFLVLAKSQHEVQIAKARIQEMAKRNIYFWIPVQGIETETVVDNDTTLNLNDLFCRYLAINEQLKQGSALSEDLRRQLEAKWESNRQAIKKILQNLYGRSGLETAKCQVYQAGSVEPLSCNSWHGFKELLYTDVNALYSQEVPIRAMNMNILRDEKYSGSAKVVKLVERILKFDENPDYQTDLLGEKKETSEPAALTDGILGANQLFIQRSNGWDIKLVEETEGNIKDLLKLLHDTFLRKRENPYQVGELRNKLVAEPYGLPACTLPLFSAVAIRHEVKRLRWGCSKESNFSKNLVEAFTKDNKLTVRLFEFSRKQSAMLFRTGECLKLEQLEGQSSEEYAACCASKLREFINNKPEGVRNSNKLDLKTQELVKYVNTKGQSDQDLADFLIDLLGVKNHLPDQDVTKVIIAIKDLFDDFLKVENENLLEIKKSWFKHFPDKPDERESIINRLRHIGTRQANELVMLLERASQAEDVDPKEVIYKLLHKRFDDSSDLDIGRCINAIETSFEQARQPHRPIEPDPQPVQNPNSFPGTNPLPGGVSEPSSFQETMDSVRHIVKKSGLPKENMIEILERLLEDYRK
ncbi:hypothetical protein Q9L42_012615 [Methylomarinum sp. Ch1-1]|uniref:Uncharacterized protein n=1 Tax=Methylomarinum roseum TaxID=3067653 RepID=A0AAU7NQG3_9GAMM|nr:hypothetical protein [Methylomarinum sp. Ch1-1]MDP4520847.1 hypothetical protein [Methylomarinum sp. Ch1-1]